MNPSEEIANEQNPVALFVALNATDADIVRRVHQSGRDDQLVTNAYCQYSFSNNEDRGLFSN